MKVLQRDKLVYAMQPQNEAVLRIAPGETVLVETEDCFGHQVVVEDYSLDDGFSYDYINPATGTILVEGAEPGDVLKVHVQKITLDAQGVVVAYKGWGPLGEEVEGTHIRVVKVKDGTAVVGGRSIPLNPMIGVIGVSPAQDSVPNSTPGAHGGNLDTKEITEGATLYLPIFKEGAHLALGDLHAAMGDGELCGTGVEIRGAAQLKIELLKGCSLKAPVVENKKDFFFLASSPVIEEAIKAATTAATEFISKCNGISQIEAYMLTSLKCDLRFSQVVNPAKTVKVRVGKDLLDQVDQECPF